MAAASAAAAATVTDSKPGKFWRPFSAHSASAMASAGGGGSAPGSGLARSSSGGSIGVRREAHQTPGGRWRGGGGEGSLAAGSSNWNGAPSENGGSVRDSGEGGGGDGGRERRAHRSRRSLPGIGSWRRNSEPAAAAVFSGGGKGVLSPPPRRSRVRQRPGAGTGGGATACAADEKIVEDGRSEGGRGWLPGGGRRPLRERRATVGEFGGKDGIGGGEYNGGGGDPFETVAKVPPWMEGVEASAEYEEMKPTLDVIKQTVLLAMLQQVGASCRRTKYVFCFLCALVRFTRIRCSRARACFNFCFKDGRRFSSLCFSSRCGWRSSRLIFWRSPFFRVLISVHHEQSCRALDN